MDITAGKILNHYEEGQEPVILVTRSAGGGRNAKLDVQMTCTDDDMLLGIKLILKERMRWLAKNDFMFNINDEAHLILGMLAEAGRELEAEEQSSK